MENFIICTLHYSLGDVASCWKQVVELNHWLFWRLPMLVLSSLIGTVISKRIRVLGLAFKVVTKVIRDLPAIRVSKDPLEGETVLQILNPTMYNGPIACYLGRLACSGEESFEQMTDCCKLPVALMSY